MDVASYSQLMGADEEGLLKNLKPVEKSLKQKSLKPREEYLTLLVMLSWLSFPILSAVNAAIAIQKQIFEHNKTISDASKRLYFRMGINLGDVMVDGDNLLGDGVNVAARLEGIAPPGEFAFLKLCILQLKVSWTVGLLKKVNRS